MTLDAFLSLLPPARRVGGSWWTRCPSHADRHPSLEVREGDRGVLVRCWAGCATVAVVAALGLRVSDLFYDARRPRGRAQAARSHRAAEEESRRALFARASRLCEAERVVERHSGIDVSTWPDDRLSAACDGVAAAWSDLLKEEEGR